MGLHLQKRKDETMMTKKIIAMKNYLRMRNEGLKDFLREEDGVGVVEVILILVDRVINGGNHRAGSNLQGTAEYPCGISL